MERRDYFSAWLFHQLCIKNYTKPDYTDSDFLAELQSSRRFFARFRGQLDVRAKSVLDVGCGRGSTCLEAALRGATRVVGADIQRDRIDYARAELKRSHQHLAKRVVFHHAGGTLHELQGEHFDIVLSKDSFEHYADPEGFISVMRAFVRPGGLLAIGFGPLWKAPTGGHIEFMTRLPWAHLLFPERVIMAERQRFRPEEQATCFEEILGGLNKMTLARFQSIVASTGLTCAYFATNVSDNPLVRVMRIPSRLPLAREFFTANVFGIWTADEGSPPNELPRASTPQGTPAEP